ncbi:MAG: hypothetical protein EBW87_03525 [Burkholderiaceae bacterium]|nr:hypothetical protein [Burkholderiaceae bacterium]
MRLLKDVKHEEQGGGIWISAGTIVEFIRNDGDDRVVIRGKVLLYCSNPAKQPREIDGTISVRKELLEQGD